MTDFAVHSMDRVLTNARNFESNLIDEVAR